MIFVSESPEAKFRQMALSIPSLKKIFYYKPRDLVNPITLIKLVLFFLATRWFVLKESLK